MALSLEIFEEKSIEARKFLHAVYVEVDAFETANAEFRVIEGEPNFFIWHTREWRRLKRNGDQYENYLKYFLKGDFKECERLINLGWAKHE